MLDEQSIETIARLARLSLSESEKSDFAQQLGSILDYMEHLNTLDTDAVEPTCFVVPAHDSLRDDTVTGSLCLEDTLRNAPHRCGDHFAIPKVIDS